MIKIKYISFKIKSVRNDITVAILLGEPLSCKLDNADSVKDIYKLELLQRNQRNERTTLPSLKGNKINRTISKVKEKKIMDNISYTHLKAHLMIERKPHVNSNWITKLHNKAQKILPGIMENFLSQWCRTKK